jgi:predicted porin
MHKKLLPLAIAAAMAAPAAQASDVTVYGKAHIALSSYDNGSAVNTGSNYVDLSSHESRLGVKGSEDLGNGLKAIFKMEMQLRLADVGNDINNGDAGTISMRNTYVGLAGDWGTFLMGRHDTPLKISTGSLDLFDGTIADYNTVAADGDDQNQGRNVSGTSATNQARGLEFLNTRADNAIAYVSPNMNGFTAAVAIVPAGESTLVGTDNANADSLAEAASAALLYGNGPFFASLAYTSYSSDIITGAFANTDIDVWRAGLGYTANNFHVGFVYEDFQAGTTLDGLNNALSDHDIWQLSGSYTFGNNVVKAAYGKRDGSGASADIDQASLGIDHMFSKRTKVYAVYTNVDSSLAGQDWSGVSAGMVHEF